MNIFYIICVTLERTLLGKAIIIVYAWVVDCYTKTRPIGATSEIMYNAQICRTVLFNYTMPSQLDYFSHCIILDDESIKKYSQKKPHDFAQELKAINEYEGVFFITANPSTFYNVLRNIPMPLLDKIHIHGSSIHAYQHKFLIKIKELLSS